MRVILIVAFALTSSSIAFAQSKPRVAPGMGGTPPNATKMTPNDIKAQFFTGTPFTAATPAGIKYKMTFANDGTMTREPVGKAGVKDAGTWKTSKDGFCTTWKGSKENCYKLYARQDNTWTVSNGSASLATWTKS